jgi:hypothetical protein
MIYLFAVLDISLICMVIYWGYELPVAKNHVADEVLFFAAYLFFI